VGNAGLRAALLTGAAVLVVAGASRVLADPGDGDAASTAARVELGRRLFFDPAVSRGGRTSCASCHDPEHGFTDRVHPSRDEWGPTGRRTMPLADLPPGELHSDGEFRTFRALLDARLEPLADLRLRRANEDPGLRSVLRDLPDGSTPPSSYGMGKGDPPVLPSVADRLAADRLYAPAFTAAFGDAAPTHARICDAVEAFGRSLRTTQSPFDRFVAGDAAALPPDAARGFALFEGKAGCAQCHLTKPVDGRAPLTDGAFHDTGVAFRAAKAAGDVDDPDLGRGARGENAADRRKGRMQFRTPSLRDVLRRGPYMHDGSLASLLHVIDWYDGGAAPHRGLDPKIRRLGLTPAEKDDLLAFLVALTGAERPGVADARAQPRRFRATLVGPAGTPVMDASVEVEPAGDRFRGDAPRPVLVKTDAAGVVEFPFPSSTHVLLRVAGHGLAGGGLVPDCADAPTLVVVPAGQVALRVRAAAGKHPRSIRAVPVPKKQTDGRIVEAPTGETMEFRLVRTLAACDAIYVADAPGSSDATALRLLVPSDGAGTLPSTLDLDLRGGSVTWVDMTPLRHQDAGGH
jgi:cytochrome c peroxidase